MGQAVTAVGQAVTAMGQAVTASMFSTSSFGLTSSQVLSAL